jgi:hypothetical protein
MRDFLILHHPQSPRADVSLREYEFVVAKDIGGHWKFK